MTPQPRACYAMGCYTRVVPPPVFCERHWAMVPLGLRDSIDAEWSAAHYSAWSGRVRDARDWIRRRESDPDNVKGRR